MKTSYLREVETISQELAQMIVNCNITEEERNYVLDKADEIIRLIHRTINTVHNCSRKAFLETTKLTIEELQGRPEYKAVDNMLIGDSVTITATKEMYSYIRSIIKTEHPQWRLRSMKPSENITIVCRTA